MTAGTVQDFVGALKAKLGKPYSETLDAGVGPDYYDCSGLVMVCAGECGVKVGRTTWDQWDTLERIGAPELGCCVYFTVKADGGNPPQHVGVWLGPNLMIEAPHTGDVVKYSTIPNSGGETVLGYCRIPFVAAQAAPVPSSPTPVPEELFAMLASDPAFAVRFLYRTCLHREADAAGYETFQQELAAGKTLDWVMAQLQDSPEGQAVLAAERKALGLS